MDANFHLLFASHTASVEKCFTRADGSSFDYVINFAAETKFSQPKEVSAV